MRKPSGNRKGLTRATEEMPKVQYLIDNHTEGCFAYCFMTINDSFSFKCVTGLTEEAAFNKAKMYVKPHKIEKIIVKVLREYRRN